MNKRILTFVAVIFALVFASVACEFSASTAKIDNAFMSLDQDGNSPTSVFAQDAIFYCIVQLANAPDDTNVKAVWSVVEAENTDPGLLINETEIDSGDGQIYFQLSNQNLWPLGTYQVEIYLNGELDQTVEFEVQ